MRPGGRLVASAGVLTSDTSRGALTEQFVIEGGVPLSGTVRPEGNKNAALPILAACLLTEEEVRLANVPRIRDVEIMAELVAHIGADVEWVGPERARSSAPTASSARSSTASCAPASAPRSCSPARCWRARARSTCRRPAATSSAAAASTRTSSRFRGARRHRHDGPRLRAPRARRPARRAHLPRRAERHRHRERDHGRGARAAARRGFDERRVRAARAGPVPLARDDGRAHRGHRLQHADHRGRRPPRPAASTRSQPDHIEVGVVRRPRGGHRAATITVTGVEREDLCSIRARASRGSAWRSSSRARPARAGRAAPWTIVDDIGGQIPKIEDGPWPQVPGRPHVDPGRGRDAGHAARS